MFMCAVGRWSSRTRSARALERRWEWPVSADADGELKVVARVNIALVEESGRALLRVQERTGLKKVDLVNRAIQLYDFLAEELSGGRQLVIRGKDGHEALVKVFL